MKSFATVVFVALIYGWGTSSWAADPARTDSALQPINQASDPSAVVAAYASAFAGDRDSMPLHDAYVRRMIDLGLPELAFHQAQLHVSMDPNAGHSWGVIAHVNARRGDMNEAMSALTLSARLQPDSKFILDAAGEILAWYDIKADKTQIPDEVEASLAGVRQSLGNKAAFTEAYTSAQKAYAEAPTPAPGPQSSLYPPQSVVPATPLYPAAVSPSLVYYNDPFWDYPYWWRPVGYFRGCDFYPSSGLIITFSHHRFAHHRHGHLHDRGHHQRWGRDHRHHRSGHNPAYWHSERRDRPAFFGAPAAPSSSVVSRQNLRTQVIRSQPPSAPTATGARSTGGGVIAITPSSAGGPRNSLRNTTPSQTRPRRTRPIQSSSSSTTITPSASAPAARAPIVSSTSQGIIAPSRVAAPSSTTTATSSSTTAPVRSARTSPTLTTRSAPVASQVAAPSRTTSARTGTTGGPRITTMSPATPRVAAPTTRAGTSIRSVSPPSTPRRAASVGTFGGSRNQLTAPRPSGSVRSAAPSRAFTSRPATPSSPSISRSAPARPSFGSSGGGHRGGGGGGRGGGHRGR